MKNDFDLLVITGPTASGKTTLAVAVANRLGGEIISADSRQVYQGMNIGTGKDYDDYIIDGRRIPCHLTDIVKPGYKYNVFEYQRDFIKVYSDIRKREIFPVVCGGSGMYIDSIVSGYRMFEVPPDVGLRIELEKKPMDELKQILSTYRDPHNTTDFDTRKRVIRAIEIEHFNRSRKVSNKGFPRVRSLVTGILLDRESRRMRITQRLKKRLNAGMIDEVRQLMQDGVSVDALLYYGLEYKYITLYLVNKITYDVMVRDLETAIHQFAKRQMTWFRGMERRGIKIYWIDSDLSTGEKVEKIAGWLGASEHDKAPAREKG